MIVWVVQSVWDSFMTTEKEVVGIYATKAAAERACTPPLLGEYDQLVVERWEVQNITD